MPTTLKIYHEKQTRQLCALHALNNLFQENIYQKAELDNICSNLSPNAWINPHRSLLGLGNYDINVIMTALEIRHCEAFWFDKRKDPSCIDLDKIVGFILNIPLDYKIGAITLPIRKRHWIAVRRIGQHYYNLDSKLRQPELLGTESDVLHFLREQLKEKEQQRELFLVRYRSDCNESPQRWIEESHDINKTAD
ncbi:GL11041 [Drosophila persimilis]|uniref:Josephin-2 n=1 Tax=Drosophila persimilis TaxID=7234 RepID=B4GBI9_DROPE|nr:josephin-like protein [Drosophila persimilis]EDW31284.1 GL11041 [Drosophila persimilis]